MSKLKIVVMLMLCGLVIGCASAAVPNVTDGAHVATYDGDIAQLQNRLWRLSHYQIDGDVIDVEHYRGSIEFKSNGEMDLFNGCNSAVNARYSIRQQSIQMTIGGFTVIKCSGALIEHLDENNNVVETETWTYSGEDRWFERALDAQYKYELFDDELHIYFRDASFQSDRKFWIRTSWKTQIMIFESAGG